MSSVPSSLPCRESEFSTVYSHLEAAISDGSGSCIYISGTPGTGKTATVREVVAQLNALVAADELDDFIFVEINGMKVTDPHQSYSLLWEALRGDRVSPTHALDLQVDRDPVRRRGRLRRRRRAHPARSDEARTAPARDPRFPAGHALR